MKKKIFALVGALVLTCAMSLNVFASGSPTAAEVAAAAQDVAGFPTDSTALEASYKVADQIFDATESTTGITLSELDLDRVMPIARELGQLRRESEAVDVKAVFEVGGISSGKLVVNVKSEADQTVYAIHEKSNGEVERIVGVKSSGDKVTFTFDSFSPVAIVVVTHKAVPQTTNNNNTTTTQAAAAAPAATTMINGRTVPTAPKTGDAAMMVAVMAVIFMVGAAVAVSRKRA